MRRVGHSASVGEGITSIITDQCFFLSFFLFSSLLISRVYHYVVTKKLSTQYRTKSHLFILD